MTQIMSDKTTCLKIFTWNINEMADKTSGDKSSQSEFLLKIDNSIVFCLEET